MVSTVRWNSIHYYLVNQKKVPINKNVVLDFKAIVVR